LEPQSYQEFLQTKFNGYKTFEFNKPKTKKTIEIINDQVLTSPVSNIGKTP